MERLAYTIDCVSAKGDDIQEMIDVSREIKRSTFIKNVDRLDLESQAWHMGYENHASKGLTMKDDWAIGYFSSKYQGRKCYYFTWSAIEHVFAN